MKVLVEFGRYYDGPPSEAVWIIASPANRSWFQRHAGTIDGNSAIFDDDVEPLTLIWHVFAHHPDWTEITVRSAILTPEIEEGIAPDAVVANSDKNGFHLRRR